MNQRWPISQMLPGDVFVYPRSLESPESLRKSAKAGREIVRHWAKKNGWKFEIETTLHSVKAKRIA